MKVLCRRQFACEDVGDEGTVPWEQRDFRDSQSVSSTGPVIGITRHDIINHSLVRNLITSDRLSPLGRGSITAMFVFGKGISVESKGACFHKLLQDDDEIFVRHSGTMPRNF